MIYNKNIIQGNLHFRHNIAIRKNFQTKTAESLHITVALFIPTGFSVLELISWVIDSIIHLQYSTCFIPKWFWFCNKSLEWIIQWLIFIICFVIAWFSVFEQTAWVNYSVTHFYYLFHYALIMLLNKSHEWNVQWYIYITCFFLNDSVFWTHCTSE